MTISNRLKRLVSFLPEFLPQCRDSPPKVLSVRHLQSRQARSHRKGVFTERRGMDKRFVDRPTRSTGQVQLFQISYVGGSSRDVVLTPAVPAKVVSWINGSGGDWNVATNWSTGTVPIGGIVEVAVSPSCVISNNANVSISQLLFNSPSCTIGGGGNFAISGLFDWQVGSFGGSGTIAANGPLHLDSPSSGLSLTGESLINSSQATWSTNTTITLSDGAILSDAPQRHN